MSGVEHGNYECRVDIWTATMKCTSQSIHSLISVQGLPPDSYAAPSPAFYQLTTSPVLSLVIHPVKINVPSLTRLGDLHAFCKFLLMEDTLLFDI